MFFLLTLTPFKNPSLPPDTVVPSLGSMDHLVVHRRYQGVNSIRNFVLRLIGGGPQNIEKFYRGSQPQKVENRCPNTITVHTWQPEP